MLQENSLVGGRYRLVAEVGRGGMGSVWRARHLALEQDVALKFMHGEIRPESAKRFLREARIAASIRHRNIVTVLDFGTEDGTPYLVMEWLDGVTLDDYCASDVPPRLGDVLDVIAGVLDGLEAVHAAGVVHRDLKPQNVFIPRNASPRAAKIVDFGVSRGGGDALVIESGLTATGQIVGTPLYMPLEQLRASKDVDARCDLYAVGVVLYEAITGRTPFVAENLADLVISMASTSPPRLSSLRPDLGALDDLLAKAIARAPEDRFQTVAELRAALDQLPRGVRRAAVAGPIEAGPTTPGSAARPRPRTVPKVSTGRAEPEVTKAHPSVPPTSWPRVALLATPALALAAGLVWAASTGSVDSPSSSAPVARIDSAPPTSSTTDAAAGPPTIDEEATAALDGGAPVDPSSSPPTTTSADGARHTRPATTPPAARTAPRPADEPALPPPPPDSEDDVEANPYHGGPLPVRAGEIASDPGF